MLTPIAADLVAHLVAPGATVPTAWLASVPVPGDEALPTLVVPADRLRYAANRGYAASFAVREVTGTPYLFVELVSFDLAEGPGGWAIPLAYVPRNDEEALRRALDFDEGWEDVEVEARLAFGADAFDFWRSAAARGRVGLTVVGGASLYPVTLGDREQAALASLPS